MGEKEKDFTIEVRAKGPRACGKTVVLMRIKELLVKEGFKVDDVRVRSPGTSSSGMPFEVLKAEKESFKFRSGVGFSGVEAAPPNQTY